jgi:hypothetical protein
MVDSTLSYAAAVWAPALALAAAARPVVGSSGHSAAELQHSRALRRLLGLPTRTPVATVLAEAGEPPLYITWLVRAARFWSTVVAAPEGSLMRQVVDASLQMAAECHATPVAQLPWAAQLQRAMAAAGVVFDPQHRATLCPDAVREAALTRYLQRVAAAAAPGAGHARLHHYFVSVRRRTLTKAGPAASPQTATACQLTSPRCGSGSGAWAWQSCALESTGGWRSASGCLAERCGHAQSGIVCTARPQVSPTWWRTHIT